MRQTVPETVLHHAYCYLSYFWDQVPTRSNLREGKFILGHAVSAVKTQRKWMSNLKAQPGWSTSSREAISLKGSTNFPNGIHLLKHTSQWKADVHILLVEFQTGIKVFAGASKSQSRRAMGLWKHYIITKTTHLEFSASFSSNASQNAVIACFCFIKVSFKTSIV